MQSMNSSIESISIQGINSFVESILNTNYQ